MDGIVFLILLLTGSCGSLQNNYYFIRDQKTWDDARAFCVKHYDGIAQIHNVGDVSALMSTVTGSRLGHQVKKAWIGLLEGLSDWTWTNGEPASYFKWQYKDEPGQKDDLCVIMERKWWRVMSCSSDRHYLCQSKNGSYSIGQDVISWSAARQRCIEQGMVLAMINSEREYDTASKKVYDEKVWIGLRREKLWFWLDSGGMATFENWQEGQPENQTDGSRCAAAALKDGTWTSESCSATYSFFCNKSMNHSNIPPQY